MSQVWHSDGSNTVFGVRFLLILLFTDLAAVIGDDTLISEYRLQTRKTSELTGPSPVRFHESFV